jgi:hypothetical protein
VVWCPIRLGCDRWLFYFRCGNAMRAVSRCAVHLVMSSCVVTVTSLSLFIFNCGPLGFDQLCSRLNILLPIIQCAQRRLVVYEPTFPNTLSVLCSRVKKPEKTWD